MSNDQEMSDAEQRLKELDDEIGEIMDEYAEIMASMQSSDEPLKNARLNVAEELINQAADSNLEALGMLEALKNQVHEADKKRRVSKKLQEMMGHDMR